MRAATRYFAGAVSILAMASQAMAQTTPPVSAPSSRTTPATTGSSVTIPGTVERDNPLAGRGGELPGVIRYIMSEGVKVTSLGEVAGVKAFLGEAANGRFQAFYVTPDGEHVMAGLLFASGGHNITNDQIAAMLKRFSDAAQAIPSIDKSLLPVVPEIKPPAVPTQDFADWMKSLGMKLTPFDGNDGGIQGYLVEAPSEGGAPGKIQPMYILPDQKHAVAGVLVKRGGMMMTGVQVGRLQQRYLEEEQARQNGLASPVEPERIVPRAEPVSPGAAQALAGRATASAIEKAPNTPDEPALAVTPPGGLRGEGAPAPNLPPGVPQPVPYIKTISNKPASASDAFLYPGKDIAQFMDAMKQTVFFTVGLGDRPAVWMLADPQCPFCHMAWGKLKPLVFDGKIQVRVIMIAGLKGSDPLARSILGRAEPSKAWLSGEGSIDNVPVKEGPAIGSADYERAGQFVRLNNGFATRYQIKSTPFLAYTTPDGKLYTSVGLPQDMDAFLAALR